MFKKSSILWSGIALLMMVLIISVSLAPSVEANPSA